MLDDDGVVCWKRQLSSCADAMFYVRVRDDDTEACHGGSDSTCDRQEEAEKGRHERERGRGGKEDEEEEGTEE